MTLPNNFTSSLLPLGVPTKIDGKLNLTRVLFDIYPPKQLKEIRLKDENRTEFAYINTEDGATTNMTENSNRPMPAFWSRLKVIDGSLMLTGIQKKDNGIKMISRADFTDLSPKGATIQILVYPPGNCYFEVFLISANSFKVDTPVRKTTLQVRHNLVGWTIFKSAFSHLSACYYKRLPLIRSPRA